MYLGVSWEKSCGDINIGLKFKKRFPRYDNR